MYIPIGLITHSLAYLLGVATFLVLAYYLTRKDRSQ